MSISHPLFIDSHNSKLEGDYLYGYTLGEDGQIYFGSEGWDQRHSSVVTPPLDGLYVWVSQRPGTTLARTDITGQESIFYYCSSNYWAISNSFYLLVQSLKSRNVSLKFNTTVMDCFLYNRGKHISAQLMSNNTLANEIRLLPQNCELRIDGEAGAFTATEVRHYDFADHVPKNTSEYSEMMYSYARKQVTLINALHDLGYGLRVSLSGGYDSREIFAAVTLAQKNNPKLEVEVFSEKSSKEYKFAEAVANQCGQPLHDRRKMFSSKMEKLHLSVNEAFNNWLIANGGVYTPVLLPTSVIAERRSMVELWGFVSYEWDYFLSTSQPDNYGKPSIKSAGDIKNEISKSHLSEPQQKQVLKEFDSFFNDIGVSSEIENAMDIYYMGTRSRHHYGRRWFKRTQNTGFQVGPLQFKEQILLNWFCASNQFDKRQFHKDLLSILNPALAELEFDSTWKGLKNLAPTFAPDVSQTALKKYSVHGTSLDAKPHTLSTFEYGRSLTRQSEFSNTHNLGEHFRALAIAALQDRDFIDRLPLDYMQSLSKEISTPIVDLPPEANSGITAIANLYSIYSAISSPPEIKASIEQPIDLKIEVIGTTINAQLNVMIDRSNLEYAFYLQKNGVRVQTIWYSQNNSCQFQLDSKPTPGDFEIIGFLRKINDDNVVYKRSKV